MRRLNKREVELTPTEAKAHDRFNDLLDEGHSCPSAADIVRKEFSLSYTFQEWLIS